MKDWWLNLSLRDKQILTLGSLIALLFLSYFFIWTPVNTNIELLRNQTLQDRDLLKWMQLTDQRLSSLDKTENPPTISTVSSLLALIQESVKSDFSAVSVSQLQQGENSSVQLNLTKVSFDHLIGWLRELDIKNKVVVRQFSVNSHDGPGVVSVRLVLST
jgi:general secretion pathway protein M